MPTASVSRLIRAPQRDVWSLLSDVAQAGRWNKYWSSIEFLSPQTHGVGTRFRATSDGGDSFVFDICDWDAPQRIAFCPVRDVHEQYSIALDSHVFEMQALSEEESSLTITAHASASGFKGRILALFFWSGHQKGGLNAALDTIQAIFEPELFEDGTAKPASPEALPE
jgi:uncharacterized protein YndB with AHSA1/START domain